MSFESKPTGLLKTKKKTKKTRKSTDTFPDGLASRVDAGLPGPTSPLASVQTFWLGSA
jgi:hypothetical protein